MTKKEEILKIYIDFVEKNNKYPTYTELNELGISRNDIRYHFNDLSYIKKLAKMEVKNPPDDPSNNDKKEEILKIYIDFVKENNKFPTFFDMKSFNVTDKMIKWRFGNLQNLKELALERVSDFADLDKNNVKENIAQTYYNFVKNSGNHPTIYDLKTQHVSESSIKSNFGNIKNLKSYVSENYDISEFILTEETVFSKIKIDALNEDLTKFNRFVISTVVSKKSVNTNFYDSIKNYCTVNNAKLICIPCQDSVSRASSFEYQFDPVLSNESFIHKDTKLNNNLFISSIKLSAKQIKPTTGLQRIGQRNGSYIFASPKQFLEYVVSDPNNQDTPNAIMTTGALTVNNYDTDRYMSDRTSYIAENDHVYGAIVVEIENDSIFHFRQVQADADGSFIDLGVRYDKKSTKPVKTDIVLGDLHVGEHDENVYQTTLQILNTLKIKDVFVHDAFSGYSISHYDDKSPHRKALKSLKNSDCFIDEVELGANVFAEILEHVTGKLYRVKGNHDEWFERYLERAGYITDAKNHYDALEYARYYLEGKDPLEIAYSNFLSNIHKKRIVFLNRDDTVKIGNVEVAQHGDLGLNGSKGSLIGSEKAYGDCVVGHSHSAAIYRSVYRVGTMTKKKLSYNKGPSNWTWTHALVYPNGSRQLINIIMNDKNEYKWRV